MLGKVKARVSLQEPHIALVVDRSDLLHPTLNVHLQYLAEGAANVIWTIELTQDTDALSDSCERAIMKGYLLRVRKRAPRIDDSSMQTYDETVDLGRTASTSRFPSDSASTQYLFRVLQDQIIPALQPYCIEHKLIRIDRNLLQQMNETLQGLEGANRRERTRTGTYLDTHEPYGFLVADMRPKNQTDITVYFKPKWLAQSPTAPAGAKRCRTCALAAYRGKHKTTDYCPLHFISGSEPHIRLAVRQIFQANGISGDSNSGAVEAVVGFFRPCCEGAAILALLKAHQQANDPDGICAMLGPDGALKDDLRTLPLAMTFRDCTLYLRLARSSGGWAVTAGLGDLDYKVPDARKRAKWLEDERALIEGGWYSGYEVLEDGGSRHTSCYLWG